MIENFFMILFVFKNIVYVIYEKKKLDIISNRVLLIIWGEKGYLKVGFLINFL